MFEGEKNLPVSLFVRNCLSEIVANACYGKISVPMAEALVQIVVEYVATIDNQPDIDTEYYLELVEHLNNEIEKHGRTNQEK